MPEHEKSTAVEAPVSTEKANPTPEGRLEQDFRPCVYDLGSLAKTTMANVGLSNDGTVATEAIGS